MAQSRELLQKGYSLSPYTLVRTTGFPFDLLDALNCPETAAALDAQEDAHSVEGIFAGEFASLLAHLKSISKRDDVREALFLSSPGAFAALRIPSADAPLRSKDRKLLKHIVLYLQRLTTKCDTNSFFGPTWWGTIGQCSELIDFSAPAHFSIAPLDALGCCCHCTGNLRRPTCTKTVGNETPARAGTGKKYCLAHGFYRNAT